MGVQKNCADEHAIAFIESKIECSDDRFIYPALIPGFNNMVPIKTVFFFLMDKHK